MKEKKVLSVVEQINIYYLYSGIAWIIGGIVHLFDSIPFLFIEVLAMGIIIFTHIKVARAKKENQDEMSIKNYHKARSQAFTYMHIIIAIIIIAFQIINVFIPDVTLNVNVVKMLIPAFFISLGIEYVMIAVLFCKFERDGEKCIF